MFDHDNQTAATAAPVSDENTAGNPSAGGQSEGQSATTHEIKLDETPVKAASEALHEGVPADAHAASQATSHETSPEAGHAIATAAAVSKTEAHTKAEAQSATHAADAEASSDADEAAGSEEMSKLMEQYDEKQEAAASKEVIEVTVVAYTEHGVVVDLGGKTEGLIPAAEFSETEIPRPEPNSKIEVQRTGEHKDGYAIVSKNSAAGIKPSVLPPRSTTTPCSV